MTADEPNVTLARLETVVRLECWGLVACAVAFVLTWGLSTSSGTPRADAPTTPGKLVARELSIVDGAGAEIAAIRPGRRDSIEERDAQVVLRLGHGSNAARIDVHASGAAMGVHGGKTQAWLAANDGDFAIVGTTNNETAQATLLAGKDPRLILGTEPGAPSRVITIKDELTAHGHRARGGVTLADFTRLNARMARGELNEVQAWQQLTELLEQLDSDTEGR